MNYALTLMKFLSLAVGISHQVLAQQPLLNFQSNSDQSPEGFEFEAQQLMHKASIEVLLSERGGYGEGLDEAYAEFGKLHFESGNFVRAADLYRQAWHLSRINTGLYGEAQLPFLDLLIEALIEMRHWDEVHDLHHLSFLIASRAFPPEDIRYVVAAELYTSWQWDAINRKLFTNPSSTAFEMAQQLSALYEEIIDRVEHAEADHAMGLTKLVLGKARTDISIARTLASTSFAAGMAGPGSTYTETRCFTNVSNPARPGRQCRRVTLPNPDMFAGPLSASRFAMGRYLKQIENSITRLERLKDSTEQHSEQESQWINSLIGVLQRESQSLATSVRPT